MPPEDSGQPDGIEKADFLDELAQTMVSARRSLADSGGRITMRRLNRREYQNTIEQLLGLKVDVSSLPADGGSGTFDTVGASQFISSDQIEQYLKLGRSAIDEAFERQATRQQPSKFFGVEPENTVNVLSRKKIAEQEETYQRYLLWKAEVDKAALLPENKKVLAELREKYNLARSYGQCSTVSKHEPAQRCSGCNQVWGLQMAIRPPFHTKVATTALKPI